ncbi:MAG: DUF454 family protein [Gammaproteobacteria bacterium]|jgi:uncharacterized protein|nr:DUF454 family protein [Gammaproteobacteria bacterium]MBT4493595.1 DUF454 family protein [Gammaproteobacteria bacterium]MBT7369763.1 DUF454 family protein [Gammaproteobacteria bacterium]
MTASGPEKLLYLTLGIIFLALGVVGLLIPIIPGVLFLAGAIYMLSRGSNRVREYAENHPQLSGFQRRMSELEAITIVERVQVAGLMALQTATVGSRKVYVGVRRLF